MQADTKILVTKMEKSGLDMIKKLIGISVGSILVAVAINALIIPYGILAGGISGIALLVQYMFDIPVYLGIFMLNIPAIIWGLKELNKEFMFYSIIGSIVIIIAIPLSKPYISVPELDMILVSIFSGIISGLGIGIILKFGASGGGTDVISVIMKKKANIPVGSFGFAFNILVLGASIFLLNLNIALYTIISMWVTGKVIDYVLYGIYRKKSIVIISQKNEIIAHRIMNELHRSVTLTNGTGGFSGQNKIIVNTVVNNFENAKIRKILEEVDSEAFMYITETVEVSGGGFVLTR